LPRNVPQNGSTSIGAADGPLDIGVQKRRDLRHVAHGVELVVDLVEGVDDGAGHAIGHRLVLHPSDGRHQSALVCSILSECRPMRRLQPWVSENSLTIPSLWPDTPLSAPGKRRRNLKTPVLKGRHESG
jgi:hypothetical protein